MDDEPLAWVPAGHDALNRSGLFWWIDDVGCSINKAAGSQVEVVRSHLTLPDQAGALNNHSSTPPNNLNSAPVPLFSARNYRFHEKRCPPGWKIVFKTTIFEKYQRITE